MVERALDDQHASYSPLPRRPREIDHFASRIASGQSSARDIDRLFLWLRDRSYGNTIIRDIGDFTAHSFERDRGIIVSDFRRFVDAFQTFNWFFWSLGYSARPAASSVEVKKVALANLSFRSDNWCQSHLGFSRIRAVNYVTSACRKITGLIPAEGPLRFTIGFIGFEKLNTRERAALMASAGAMPDQVFGSDDIRDQLTNVLQKNAFDPDIISAIEQQNAMISAYFIEKMNGCYIQISPESRVRLKMSSFSGKLSIFGEFVLPWGEVQAEMHHPVFQSECNPSDWLVLKAGESWETYPYDSEHELRDGKLVRMA